MVVKAVLTVTDWLLVPAAEESVIELLGVKVTVVPVETDEQVGALETTTV